MRRWWVRLGYVESATCTGRDLRAPRFAGVLLVLASGSMARAQGGSASDSSGPGASGPEATRPPSKEVAPEGASPSTTAKRSGVVLATSTGAGIGSARGYPNDANKLDDPRYFTAGGFQFGGGGELFLGGALAETLNFGLWFAHGQFANNRWVSSLTGGGIRIEAFPLHAHATLNNLALFAKFGLGMVTLRPVRDHAEGAELTQSYVGLGSFYEFRIADALGGHFSLAPAAELDVAFSRSGEGHGLTLGGRFAFYGGG